MKLADQVTYPVGVIAEMLVLTERQVQSLAKQGILPKADRGQYELVPVIQAYVGYLRNRNLGRGDDEAASPGQTLVSERARVVRAEAERLERRNAEERGLTYQKSQIQQAVGSMIEMAKARLGRVAAKISPSDMKLRRSISVAINEALSDLAVSSIDEAGFSGGSDNEDD